MTAFHLQKTHRQQKEKQYEEQLEQEEEQPLTTTTAQSYATSNNKSIDIISGNATIVSSIINLLNTVVGAGMLGLPHGFSESGYVGGVIYLLSASFFSGMGLLLLSKSAMTVGTPSSFYSVAQAAVPKHTFLIDFAVALKCFGVATGYFITVGDCMVDAFEFFLPNVEERHSGGKLESWELEEILISRHFWILLGLLIVMPISFFKTLDSLKMASSVSLVIIYTLVIMVVLYGHDVFDPCEGYNDDTNNNKTSLVDLFVGEKGENERERIQFLLPFLHHYKEDLSININLMEETCQGDTELMTPFSESIQNFAIFVFSFTCHQNIFSVVNEISDRTQARVNSVIIMTILSALAVYCVVAIEGYRTYGSEVEGDILLNYPQTLPVSLMRIGLSLMVLLSYPLQLNPSRKCIITLVETCTKWWEEFEKLRSDQINREIEDEICKDSVYIDKIDDILTHENDALYVTDDDDNHANMSLEEIENKQRLEEISKNFLFNGITISFLVLSFFVAMTISDLSFILAIVGATGSTVVSYILPGLIYLKLHPHWHFMRVMALLQLGLGVAIVPTALFFIIFKGASGR